MTDMKLYPDGWGLFALKIRVDRAQGQCECIGECGLHQPHATLFKAATEPRRCTERQGQEARWAKGMIMLTVAHLNAPGGPCACQPLCKDAAHVKAMCQRCHLRYDVELHTQHRTEKRDAVRRRNAIV